jgi:hypothetical protein
MSSLVLRPLERNYAGITYIIYGKTGGYTAPIDLNTLPSSDGFVIYGVAELDLSGFSVSSADDFNNDGITDVIISAPGADPSGRSFAGTSYVVSGVKFSPTPSTSLSSRFLQHPQEHHLYIMDKPLLLVDQFVLHLAQVSLIKVNQEVKLLLRSTI